MRLASWLELKSFSHLRSYQDSQCYWWRKPEYSVTHGLYSHWQLSHKGGRLEVFLKSWTITTEILVFLKFEWPWNVKTSANNTKKWNSTGIFSIVWHIGNHTCYFFWCPWRGLRMTFECYNTHYKCNFYKRFMMYTIVY